MAKPGAGAHEVAEAGEVSSRVGAFAISYARAYLADSSQTALTPYLAEGVAVPHGGGPTPADRHAAQVEIAGHSVSQGQEIVTVECELLNGSIEFLAVPIVRSSAGEVAASGAPAFVAAPGKGRISAERSQPIPGADAKVIRSLASRFTEAYVSGSSAADLELMVTPGAEVQPVGGLELVGPVDVTQLGDGSGPRRTLVARATVSAGAGAAYPVTYELEVARRGRWYVSAIEGEIR